MAIAVTERAWLFRPLRERSLCVPPERSLCVPLNALFDEHISKITSTANSRLGIIRNTFHIIDKEGFLILYKSNVRQILGYGISVWSPHLRKHDKEIEQIQRRATRLIK